MYDIVLVRPNDKKAIYSGIPNSSTASDPPYYMALMGGYLNQAGISVRLLDAENDDLSPSEAAKNILDMEPRLIGIIPLGSNLTASTWKMNGASILASEIKKQQKQKKIQDSFRVFIWGYHVSALPERTLEEEDVDFVITGEGFDTIISLLNDLKTNNSTSVIELDGLWYRENGTIKGNYNPSLIKDLNALPVNGWDLLSNYNYRNHMHFAFEDLSKRNKYGAILTSMGCPYNCSYCAIHYFHGERKIRYKSGERVADEAEYLVKKHDVYYLRIMDECFTTNLNHVTEVCHSIINRKLNVSIWAYARIDHINKKILEMMYEAGVRWLGIGIETGSQVIRENVYKGQYSLEQIKDTISLILDSGISVCDNYMFGLPGDTIETMQQTLTLARELNCGYPNMYCTMAYPGSQLYKNARKEDLPETWLGYAQLSYETKPLPTATLTAAEVLSFRDYAFNAFFQDNDTYFKMIEKKFGMSAVNAIKETLSHGKLKRKILE